MKWYWVLYFKALYQFCKLIGVPNDLSHTDTWNPIARWFFYHGIRASYRKLIDLKYELKI